MHSYLFSCVCRLDTPGCCHLTRDGQLRPGLYSCGHFRWHTSNTPRRCAPCQLCSGRTIPNTLSRQDPKASGSWHDYRHKVREEEVAPKGRNATIQFPLLVHCKHGCLIYCHTAAFSMSIRLPLQEWGPTPLINNKGPMLPVADKGLMPIVCDVPLTSTGLACRPQSNPKGKPSRPKRHTFVLALFSCVICKSRPKGNRTREGKGP